MGKSIKKVFKSAVHVATLGLDKPVGEAIKGMTGSTEVQASQAGAQTGSTAPAQDATNQSEFMRKLRRDSGSPIAAGSKVAGQPLGSPTVLGG